MEILSFTGLGSLPAILPGLKLLDWSLRLLPLWSRNIISWQDLVQHVLHPSPFFLIFSSWSMLFLCTSMLQCSGSFSYLSMNISSLRLGSIPSSFSSWSLSSDLCIYAFCDLSNHDIMIRSIIKMEKTNWKRKYKKHFHSNCVYMKYWKEMGLFPRKYFFFIAGKQSI